MSDIYDSQCSALGFSWGPNPKGCLRNIEYFDQHQDRFLIEPALLSNHGLTVQGILWRTTHDISVPQTQARFASMYQEELETQRRTGANFASFNEHIEPLVQEFVWSLLHELVSDGWLDIARTLWTYFRPRQRYSRKPVVDHSFDAVFLSPVELDKEHIIKKLKGVNMFVDAETEFYNVFKEPSLARIMIE